MQRSRKLFPAFVLSQCTLFLCSTTLKAHASKKTFQFEKNLNSCDKTRTIFPAVMDNQASSCDRAGHTAFNLLTNELTLPHRWRSVDDNVMGGRSKTDLSTTHETALLFEGIINTNGGGFCSFEQTCQGTS
jgi:hypothetical protein